MHFKLFLPLLATVVYGGIPNAPDMFGMINVLYFKADANLDRVITEAELDDVYEGFDANHDGKTSHDEFVPWWAAITHQKPEMASAYFFLADLNDDGFITDDDVRPAYVRFDLDGDGVVTAEEFNLKWQEVYRESPLAVLYLRADTNKDDDLQPTELPAYFSSLTNTSDGSVTAANFEAAWLSNEFGDAPDARALFAAMDANKDGTATPSEAKSFLMGYDMSGNGNIEIIEVVQIVKLFPPLNNN